MKIIEIVDSSGELIGNSDMPQSGADLETVANKTTDQNMSMGHQPYRDDMRARFGFLGMPFYEGKDDDDILNEIDEKVFEYVTESMKYYYKNPDKLKTGYRNVLNKKLNEAPSNINGYVKSITDGVLDIVESYFKKVKGINESNVIEDKMITAKTEIDLSSTKTDDNDIKSKNVQNIAGLINTKMNKQDISKLINLLERNE